MIDIIIDMIAIKDYILSISWDILSIRVDILIILDIY